MILALVCASAVAVTSRHLLVCLRAIEISAFGFIDRLQ